MIKRLIGMLLLISMLVSVFVSCKKENTEEESDDTTVSTEEVSTEETVSLDLPEDLDYGGADIRILVRTSSLTYHEFKGGSSPTIVESAVFERNVWVEDRLNVNLTFNSMPGFRGGANAFMDEIRNSIAGDVDAYDILSPTHYFGNKLILEGCYQDLADMEYIDLEQGYWWDGYTKHVSINDKVYTVTGDYSVDSLACLQAVWFNKKLAETNKLDNPYEMVENGTWTLENLLSMAKDAAVDLDGDGDFEGDDQKGLILGSQAMTAIPVACNQFYITKNGETDFDVTLMSQKAETILSYMKSALSGNGVQYFAQTSEITDMVEKFTKGEAVFMMHSFESITSIRTSSVDYGILVYPKYDANQTEYITPSTGGTVFAIPINLNEEDTERSAAVLQALGYASYMELTPAYFEMSLKSQATRDEESYAMLDKIRETAVFEAGQVWMDCISRANAAFNDCVIGGKDQSLSGWYASYGGVMETELRDLINNKYFK